MALLVVFMHMLGNDHGTDTYLLCAKHTLGAGKLWKEQAERAYSWHCCSRKVAGYARVAKGLVRHLPC